ncbi:MAG: class I SAM-dependent methyltransferase [Candidatus Hydrogenedentales bacterium]
MDEAIRCTDDVLRMLDSLLRDEGPWWDRFYADRSRPVPFFVEAPDENLVEYFETKRMTPGRVLELGCGPGRNALYFAKRGCTVDAVDVSPAAIEWARERAKARGLNVNFVCESVFDFAVDPGAYDIVYDAGCLHHIPPHRRFQYVPIIERALNPGGLFGLVCMRGGCENGGAEISDWDVYRTWSMQGGLAYPRERLMALFEDKFELLDLRVMHEIAQPAPIFGKDFLWVGLFRKRP